MPYIKEKDRDRFSDIVLSINETKIQTPRELTLLIGLLIKFYLGDTANSYVGIFGPIIDLLALTPIENRGQLNYLITKTIKSYIDWRGEKYDHYDDAINVLENIKLDLRPSARDLIAGTLECVKMELYARKTRPYEDLKIAENGDVY